MNKSIFLTLAKKFKDHGFSLYMIGGTSRDYLLGMEVLDYDFVTDATPLEMKTFLEDANYTFEKYGSVSTKVDGTKVDIVTFRKEEGYDDLRHPSKITFVKSIEEDFIRRDFTINAIYIDDHFNVIDPSNGVNDLKNKIIRFIGDPETRIKEDPLRIHRAERFQKRFNFSIEENSLKAIEKNRCLLDKLNPEKIKSEERKEK